MSNFGTRELDMPTDMWDNFTSIALPQVTGLQDPSLGYSDNSMDKFTWFLMGNSRYYEEKSVPTSLPSLS